MKRWAVLLLLLSLLLTGCSAQPDTAPTIRRVETQTVQTGSSTDTMTVSGNIVPTETVKVSFKVAGRVNNVYPAEGELVKAGQVIAKMDTTDYSIAVQASDSQLKAGQSQVASGQLELEAGRAELEALKLKVQSEVPAAINQAKAQLDLTQNTYDRTKALFEAGVATQADLDAAYAKLTVDQATYQQALDAQTITEAQIRQAEAKVESAQAQVEQGQAQLKQAQSALDLANSNLSDTTLTSPITGVVLQKVVASGEMTSAGYPIVAIGKVDDVWVEIGVTDDAVGKLYKGQSAAVYVYGTDQTVTGTVDEIGALADTTTRTFPVKIRVHNPDGTLLPGMIAKVDISLSDTPGICIPLDSVIQLADGSSVFLYDEATGTVSRRMIETGEIVGDQIEVLAGLESGECLVTAGQFVLHDGEQVQLADDSAGTSTAAQSPEIAEEVAP